MSLLWQVEDDSNEGEQQLEPQFNCGELNFQFLLTSKPQQSLSANGAMEPILFLINNAVKYV